MLTRRGPALSLRGTDERDSEWKQATVAVAVSPDGRLIIRSRMVIDSEPRIQSQILVTIQEVTTGKMLRPLRAPTQSISTLAFNLDSRTLTATGWQSPILVRDVTTGKLRRRLTESQTYPPLAFSPDGARLACAVMQDGKTRNVLHIWNLSTGKQVQRFLGTGSQNGSLQFARDGLRLLS